MIGMAAAWTQSDIDKLKLAIADGALEIEFDGPPRRRLKRHSLKEMRDLLAEMCSEVAGQDAAPRRRLVKTSKGFR